MNLTQGIITDHHLLVPIYDRNHIRIFHSTYLQTNIKKIGAKGAKAGRDIVR